MQPTWGRMLGLLLAWTGGWVGAGEALPALTVKVEKFALAELQMSTTDALQGKPFILEDKDGWFIWRGLFNPLPVGLTDARSPNTPTEDLLLAGGSLRWELGGVPPEGRQLQQFRLWWGLGDSARNGINIRFFVHDATTLQWRDVTGELKEDSVSSEANRFKSMTVTFPAGTVSNFDAVRLVDLRCERKIPTTRWIEVDLFTAPARPLPVMTVETVDLTGLQMATDDALQGKTFTLEPDIHVSWRGQTVWPGTGVKSYLTDARGPDTDTAELIVGDGPPEVALRWELGSPPAEGRALSEIRLWWSLSDGQRNSLNVKFCVHDAASREWQEITPYYRVEAEVSRPNFFKVLKLRFPPGAVANFDALRMMSGEGLVKAYHPRLVELDMLTQPLTVPAVNPPR